MTPPVGEQPAYRIQRNGRDLTPSELPMQYAIAQRTHVTNDIEIVRADGTVVYVQNDVEPLYDKHGSVCGCVSVCVDMTGLLRNTACDTDGHLLSGFRSRLFLQYRLTSFTPGTGVARCRRRADAQLE